MNTQTQKPSSLSFVADHFRVTNDDGTGNILSAKHCAALDNYYVDFNMTDNILTATNISTQPVETFNPLRLLLSIPPAGDKIPAFESSHWQAGGVSIKFKSLSDTSPGLAQTKPLPGHYLTAQAFETASITEFVDTLSLVKLIQSLKDTDTKANILKALHEAIALPSERQAAIDEAYLREFAVNTARIELESYLHPISIVSDKSLTGCVRLDLTPEQTTELQALTAKDTGAYPVINITAQPAKMDGFIVVSPARYFITVEIKQDKVVPTTV
jgi:hypothetical protein